jgi:hypothetical protein
MQCRTAPLAAALDGDGRNGAGCPVDVSHFATDLMNPFTGNCISNLFGSFGWR